MLRKLQTEKAQEVKEMRLKLDHAKTVKDQAQARHTEIRPAVLFRSCFPSLMEAGCDKEH